MTKTKNNNQTNRGFRHAGKAPSVYVNLSEEENNNSIAESSEYESNSSCEISLDEMDLEKNDSVEMSSFEEEDGGQINADIVIETNVELEKEQIGTTTTAGFEVEKKTKKKKRKRKVNDDKNVKSRKFGNKTSPNPRKPTLLWDQFNDIMKLEFEKSGEKNNYYTVQDVVDMLFYLLKQSICIYHNVKMNAMFKKRYDLLLDIVQKLGIFGGLKVTKPKKPVSREYVKKIYKCLRMEDDYKIPSNFGYNLCPELYKLVAVLLSFGFFNYMDDEHDGINDALGEDGVKKLAKRIKCKGITEEMWNLLILIPKITRKNFERGMHVQDECLLIIYDDGDYIELDCDKLKNIYGDPTSEDENLGPFSKLGAEYLFPNSLHLMLNKTRTTGKGEYLYRFPDADLDDPNFLQLARLIKFYACICEYMLDRENVEIYRFKYMELFGDTHVIASSSVKKTPPTIQLNSLEKTLRGIRMSLSHGRTGKFKTEQIEQYLEKIENELDPMVEEWMLYIMFSDEKDVKLTLNKLNKATDHKGTFFDIEHLGDRGDFTINSNDEFEADEFDVEADEFDVEAKLGDKLLKALALKIPNGTAGSKKVWKLINLDDVRQIFPITWLLKKRGHDLNIVDKKTGKKKITSCPCPTTGLSQICRLGTHSCGMYEIIVDKMIKSPRNQLDLSPLFCTSHKKKMMIEVPRNKNSKRPPAKTAQNLRKMFNVDTEKIISV